MQEVLANPAIFENRTSMNWEVSHVRHQSDENYYLVGLRTDHAEEKVVGILGDGMVWYPYKWCLTGTCSQCSPRIMIPVILRCNLLTYVLLARLHSIQLLRHRALGLRCGHTAYCRGVLQVHHGHSAHAGSERQQARLLPRSSNWKREQTH